MGHPCLPKRTPEVLRGRDAIAGLLGQSRHDDLLDPLGDVVSQRPDGSGVLGEDLREERDVGGGLERGLPRQHLVRDAAEREDVAPGIDVGLAHRLFRAHVVRGPQTDAGTRQAGVLPHVGREGDAEVGDDRVVVLEEDVARLHVAMDDPLFVGVLQRVGDARGHAHDLVDLQPPPGVEPLPKRFARHEGGDEVDLPVRLPRVVQREDVRMLEVRRRPDLAQEPRRPDRVGELGSQNLDRHLATMALVGRKIDRRHAARPDLADDRIPPAQGVVEGGDGIGHRGKMSPPRSERQVDVVPSIAPSCTPALPRTLHASPLPGTSAR